MPLLEATPIEHFVVIGAGASKGARDPWPRPENKWPPVPPLGGILGVFTPPNDAEGVPGPWNPRRPVTEVGCAGTRPRCGHEIPKAARRPSSTRA